MFIVIPLIEVNKTSINFFLEQATSGYALLWDSRYSKGVPNVSVFINAKKEVKLVFKLSPSNDNQDLNVIFFGTDRSKINFPPHKCILQSEHTVYSLGWAKGQFKLIDKQRVCAFILDYITLQLRGTI